MKTLQDIYMKQCHLHKLKPNPKSNIFYTYIRV